MIHFTRKDATRHVSTTSKQRHSKLSTGCTGRLRAVKRTATLVMRVLTDLTDATWCGVLAFLPDDALLREARLASRRVAHLSLQVLARRYEMRNNETQEMVDSPSWRSYTSASDASAALNQHLLPRLTSATQHVERIERTSVFVARALGVRLPEDENALLPIHPLLECVGLLRYGLPESRPLRALADVLPDGMKGSGMRRRLLLRWSQKGAPPMLFAHLLRPSIAHATGNTLRGIVPLFNAEAVSPDAVNVYAQWLIQHPLTYAVSQPLMLVHRADVVLQLVHDRLARPDLQNAGLAAAIAAWVPRRHRPLKAEPRRRWRAALLQVLRALVAWVRAAADAMEALRMVEAWPQCDVQAEAAHRSALARAHRRRLQDAERARFACDNQGDRGYSLLAPPTLERAATQPPRPRPHGRAVTGLSRHWLLPSIAPVVHAAGS